MLLPNSIVDDLQLCAHAEIEVLNRQEAFLRTQAAEIAHARRAERRLRMALESRSSIEEREVIAAFEEHTETQQKAERLLQEAACKADAQQHVEVEPEEEKRSLFMAKVEAAAELSRHKEELHKVEMEIEAEQEYLRQHEENLRQRGEHLASVQKAEMEAQERLECLSKEETESPSQKQARKAPSPPRRSKQQQQQQHGGGLQKSLNKLGSFVKSAWQQATALDNSQ
ncbi:hypothetical protein DUNSADRAFT_18176 [Dunaliella salina]|uniref:Uncharacterized protein n=1 Tax=Dunaliella salina TaxID=3046 RepID=A0ABQ7G0K0_DUNSA|nr:hypothetical protein DUNSADRAFT_18176 [Dunaliella salina]|eukprot:KAF5828124.1 hypothetical protein DUNSADRAFT_18176 [Dunaliella salina]